MRGTEEVKISKMLSGEIRVQYLVNGVVEETNFYSNDKAFADSNSLENGGESFCRLVLAHVSGRKQYA